jgi:cyanate permease
MNTCANIAGGIAPILTAHLAAAFGWTTALDVAALVSFTGAVIWLAVDASDNIETDAEFRFREAGAI